MKNRFWSLLSNIRNGQLAKKSFIVLPRKNLSETLLQILWDEGYILGYTIQNSSKLRVFLKYSKEGLPVLSSVKLLSKPNQRIYYSINQIWKIGLNGTLIIISTNKGLKTLRQCKKEKISGEPLMLII